MVSTTERARRYAGLRAAMHEAGFDALLICGRDESGGAGRGRIQYVTDSSFLGGACFVLLPQAGDAVFVQPCEAGAASAQAAGWITDIRVPRDPVAAILDVLKERDLENGTVGIVGQADLMTLQHYEWLTAQAKDVTFADATECFDNMKVVKSGEEIELARETSNILRRALTALESILRPGLTERFIVAELVHRIHDLGGINGFILIARSGGNDALHPPTADRVQVTDMLGLDVEYRGPHGYATEVTRYYSFQEPVPEVKRRFDAQASAFERCVEVIRPGASTAVVMETIGQAYRDTGFGPAGPVGWGPVHLHAHGIGLDFDEPPMIPGPELTFQADTMLNLHPRLAPEGKGFFEATAEDNLLINAQGTRPMTYDHPVWTVL